MMMTMVMMTMICTNVKLKRAFKKSDCAGTQGAASPSPSAQLSRVQPLNFHYYKHFYFHYLNHYNFHYKEYNIHYYN